MQFNDSVVIIREKESVVIRGMEIKLDEIGYTVYKCSGDEYDVKHNLDHAAIFIIYLSGDILENAAEMSNLIAYSSLIRESDRKMILIGEKKCYDDLIKKISTLASYPWIDRPVDMDELVATIKKVEKDSMEAEANELTDLSMRAMAALGVIAGDIPDAEKKHILIVDDDPAYAKMVKGWLKDTYKVDIVTAGMQAITFLLNQSVDLVLLDYDMPVVDGPQVLEMFRMEPQLKNLPVVFLTGVGDMESVKRVMALKPKGYILKSTPKEDLMKYLAEHIY